MTCFFRTIASMAALLAAGLPALASAQDYPNRRVSLIVANAPGGGSDLIARLIAQRLQAI